MVPRSRGRPDLTEALRQDGKRADRDVSVLERGHHVLDRADFNKRGPEQTDEVKRGHELTKCEANVVHAVSVYMRVCDIAVARRGLAELAKPGGLLRQQPADQRILWYRM